MPIQGAVFSAATTLNSRKWRSWTEFLLSDLRYPRARIRHESDPDVLLVHADDSQSTCLFVVTKSRPHLPHDYNFAQILQTHHSPHVVVGTPKRHSVSNCGPYGLSKSPLHRVPSWIHAFTRESNLSRSHALLPFPTEQAIRIAVSSCHNAIHSEMAKDPAAAFDILSLVIAAKIMDEIDTRASYRFWSPSTDSETACESRLIRLLEDAAEWLATGRRESIAATPPSRVGGRVARTIFDAFQTHSLLTTSTGAGGTDILGLAYERMVGATFRGELGSYFTPRTIADFMVRLLDIRQGTLLDPACGSAGLLAAALRNIRSEGNQPGQLDVYGNDLNPRMVQAARVNFLVHGVDRRRIRHGDGLDYEAMFKELLGRPVKDSSTFFWNGGAGPFDFVLANPPFAGRETKPSVLSRIESAANGTRKWKSLNRTLPFLEVILAALRDGGSAGLVIPTSVLNAEEKSFRVFRKLLLERAEILAIIGLPEKAFVHTDCGVHGVLLFFRRARDPRVEYDIFVAWAHQLGYDRLGKPTRSNDFPKLIQRFRSGDWRAEERVSVSELKQYGRWDPAWLRVVRDLPNPRSPDFVPLTELMELRNARWSRRNIAPNGHYQYFEVADCNVDTGHIEQIHDTTGIELLKKGRIRNRVIIDDILLPNHRDSLIAASGRNGRSCAVVDERADGTLTTDRFLVIRSCIDPAVLVLLLNSAGVRRQLVAHCRGAASLDIRPSILESVLVPRSLLKTATVKRINAIHKNIETARASLANSTAELDQAIEQAFRHSHKSAPSLSI